jgi:hypothetical protein
MLIRLAITLTAIVVLAAPAHAQKKKAGIGNISFWSAPKNPHAPAFVPGLQAALELTPEQVQKIVAVRDETLDSEEVRALKKKGDPNATPEELAAAAEKRKEVAEKFHKEIGSILTHDQKALIQSINDAYAAAVADAADEYKDKLVAAKGNAEETSALRKEQREAVVAAFGKKLDGVLSEKQRALVKQAAEEEAKRAGNKVKPKK